MASTARDTAFQLIGAIRAHVTGWTTPAGNHLVSPVQQFLLDKADALEQAIKDGDTL